MIASIASLGAGAPPALAQTAALPDDKLQCANEVQIAQRLRYAGKLVDASKELANCARPACPQAIRSNCSLWQHEVIEEIPSILVHARDASGAELRDVRLVVDAKRAAQSPGDQPVNLDPGDHVIEFSHPGAAPVTETVHLEAGQKNHLVTVGFKRALEALPLARPNLGTSAVSSASTNTPKVLAWTATGLSLAALGTFAYFGTTGKSELNALNETCQFGCEKSRIDGAWRKLVIADVSLGVAFASACAATYFFLAQGDNGDKTQHNTKVVASLAPGASGVTIHWRGEF
jgi:hypothetical protein